MPRAHEPVLPHHAEAPHGPEVRSQDEDAVYPERGVHARGSQEDGCQEYYCSQEGYCCCEVDGRDGYILAFSGPGAFGVVHMGIVKYTVLINGWMYDIISCMMTDNEKR